MLPATCLIACLATMQNDAEAIIRAVAAEMENVADEAFIYEGEFEYIGPRDALKKIDPADIGVRFQGSFAARSDGSVFIDSYHRANAADALLNRDTGAVFDGKTERIRQIPDQKVVKPQQIPGAQPRALLSGCSPLRLTYTWQFRKSALSDFPNPSFHGYETISDRKCPHVSCDTFSFKMQGAPNRTHYWFDLGRGGHPIRVEYRDGDGLVLRVTIELSEVEADDHSRLWYPTRCIVEYFRFDKRKSTSPFSRETTAVVPSSLRLNQGLADSVFSIASKGGVADTSGLANLRHDFENPPPRPKERTDFKSVQERLDRDLAKADEQCKRLDASAGARDDGIFGWLPAVFIILGIGIVLGAVWVMRRR